MIYKDKSTQFEIVDAFLRRDSNGRITLHGTDRAGDEVKALLEGRKIDNKELGFLPSFSGDEKEKYRAFCSRGKSAVFVNRIAPMGDSYELTGNIEKVEINGNTALIVGLKESSTKVIIQGTKLVSLEVLSLWLGGNIPVKITIKTQEGVGIYYINPSKIGHDTLNGTFKLLDVADNVSSGYLASLNNSFNDLPCSLEHSKFKISKVNQGASISVTAKWNKTMYKVDSFEMLTITPEYRATVVSKEIGPKGGFIIAIEYRDLPGIIFKAWPAEWQMLPAQSEQDHHIEVDVKINNKGFHEILQFLIDGQPQSLFMRAQIEFKETSIQEGKTVWSFLNTTNNRLQTYSATEMHLLGVAEMMGGDVLDVYLTKSRDVLGRKLEDDWAITSIIAPKYQTVSGWVQCSVIHDWTPFYPGCALEFSQEKVLKGGIFENGAMLKIESGSKTKHLVMVSPTLLVQSKVFSLDAGQSCECLLTSHQRNSSQFIPINVFVDKIRTKSTAIQTEAKKQPEIWMLAQVSEQKDTVTLVPESKDCTIDILAIRNKLIDLLVGVGISKIARVLVRLKQRNNLHDVQKILKVELK